MQYSYFASSLLESIQMLALDRSPEVCVQG